VAKDIITNKCREKKYFQYFRGSRNIVKIRSPKVNKFGILFGIFLIGILFLKHF